MTTLDLLLQEEKKLGRSQVEHACKQYLKLKTHAGVVPTPRKKIPKHWLMWAYDRQGGICQRCQKFIPHIDLSGDHLIALHLGGEHEKSNIVALHKRCNSAKGANDLVKESKRTGRPIVKMLVSDVDRL